MTIDEILLFTGKLEKFNRHNFDTINAINLNEVTTSKRDGGYGTSTVNHSNVWFNLPKGQALFKNQEKTYQNINAWNEIICSMLCKQIDIECADYDFAYLGYNEFGTVSYNFLKPNESLISGKHFLVNYAGDFHNTFINYEKAFEFLDKNPKNVKYVFNKDEILFGLYKILLFDYLTSQLDRHYHNVCFILSNDKKHQTLRLAPLFDNEMSFGAFNRSTVSDFINYTNKNQIIEFMNLPAYFPIKRVHSHEDLADDIIKLTMSNEKFKNYYHFVMENLSLDKCFDDLFAKNIPVPHVQMLWYKYALDVKKNLLIESEKQFLSKSSQENFQDDEMQL